MIASTLYRASSARHPEVDDGPSDDVVRSANDPGDDARGLHVAIIMDGNGRWARARERPRAAGHVAGVDAVRRTVEAAPALGITVLTVYAFSSDNWTRPRREVAHLMRLFRRYLDSERARCIENGVRLSVIGRRDRLPPGLVDAIDAAESRTATGRRLHLRIAVDYSARDAIVAAAASIGGNGPCSRERFRAALARAIHAPAGTPDVDLLIRTGGERRLSDFLLWECAYAEFVFTERPWPDFIPADLEAAVLDFASRDRRFGGLGAEGAGPASRSRRPGGTSARSVRSQGG